MSLFGYLSKENILKVSEEKDAKSRSINGKIVPTSIPVLHGNPSAKDREGKTVIVTVYSLNEAYLGGNKKDGEKIDLTKYPDILALYKAVM